MRRSATAPGTRTSSRPGSDRGRLGLISVHRRHRSVRRHQIAVAAVRHRQPDARGHRALRRDRPMIRSSKPRYALVTLLPLAWLVAVTMTAGVEKIFSAMPNVGFLAHAAKLAAEAGGAEHHRSARRGNRRLIWNDRIDAAMTAFFIAVVACAGGFRPHFDSIDLQRARSDWSRSGGGMTTKRKARLAASTLARLPAQSDRVRRLNRASLDSTGSRA